MRALVLSAAAAVALAAASPAGAGPAALPGDQLDKVTSGSLTAPTFFLDVYKNVNIYKAKDLDVKAMLKSLLDIKGNLAESEAAATAIGKASFSETLTLTEAVQDMYSRSFAESVSGANNPTGYQPPKTPHKPPCRC